MKILEIKNINKYYTIYKTEKQHVLKDLSLSFENGEFVSILGESGCGKSTLMNIIGCMDNDFNGDLFIDGVNIRELKGSKIDDYRKKKIGFIFQSFNLISHLTILENVTIAMEIVSMPEKERVEEIEKRHGTDISKFIEKSIIFSAYNGNEEEIYEAFNKKSKQLILTIMPFLEPYADLIIDLLNEELEANFFFDLDFGYNPEEITVAYSLGIRDCFNSPSLIYSCENEYGDKCYPAEYVEDEYIPNAMKLAMIYFKDAKSPNWKETFEYKMY